MELGMIGLGRMGAAMTQRLLRGGCRVVVYDQDPARMAASTEEGAVGTQTLEAVVTHLRPPRAIWVMVPAGDATEHVIEALTPQLAPGDTIIDGGNAFYRDSIRRAEHLASHGVEFLDVGTSGGIRGRETGYCLMVGGHKQTFGRLEPVMQLLAGPDGYFHVGDIGSGHFAKMVHNGIEYGLLQAYAEGFALLHHAPYSFDLARLAGLWNHGTIVRSWLLELAQDALQQEADLASVRGQIDDSGEGRWAVREAVALGVPVPVMTEALFARFRSRMADGFGDKLIAALRHAFGGHPVKRGPTHVERR